MELGTQAGWNRLLDSLLYTESIKFYQVSRTGHGLKVYFCPKRLYRPIVQESRANIFLKYNKQIKISKMRPAEFHQ